MGGARDPVRQHAGEREPLPIGGQAVGEGTEGLRHRPGVDDGERRDPETLGQIGARGLPVEQPHDALDHDQLGLARGDMEQTPAFGLADHPEIELIDRLPAGRLKEHRIDEVGPGLEDPHAPPPRGVVARERRGDRGLALARGRCGDQERRAAARGVVQGVTG